MSTCHVKVAWHEAHEMPGCSVESSVKSAAPRPRHKQILASFQLLHNTMTTPPCKAKRRLDRIYRRAYRSLLLACAVLPTTARAFLAPRVRTSRLLGEHPFLGLATPVTTSGLDVPLDASRTTMGPAFSLKNLRRRPRRVSSKVPPSSSPAPSELRWRQASPCASIYARFVELWSRSPAGGSRDIVFDAEVVDETSSASTAAAGGLRSSHGRASHLLMSSFRSRAGALRRRMVRGAGCVFPIVSRVSAQLRERWPRVAGAAGISFAAFMAMQRPATGVVARRGGSLMALVPPAGAGLGSAGSVAATADSSMQTIAPKLALWFLLFVTSAAFHSAEIAITTLYPWKVKEFAEEEGESSPFQVLNKDITRVLTSILVTTTVCTIYNAALFTNLSIQDPTYLVVSLPLCYGFVVLVRTIRFNLLASFVSSLDGLHKIFGSAGLAYATACLTVTTLFFGELLPKALGVNNAEIVARSTLPVVIVVSWMLNPVAKSFTLLSKNLFYGLAPPEETERLWSESMNWACLSIHPTARSANADRKIPFDKRCIMDVNRFMLMLSLLGFKSTETGRVSEEELRLIVTGAKLSGGIESQEGSMIEGVLDLQDTKISEIMRPRVEVVAIEANSTMMDLYALHQESHYSRIPVYSGEIDRISGVVLSKDLLDYVQDPTKLSAMLVADAMESTYFVPETMSVWNVLEEMRRRRLHMAIVVDEYGGTAGVVTLEDILEEVVGEIYDEKEDEEFREEEHYINVNEDGSFTIHGMADLEDVCTSLALQEVNEEDLREFGTLSGYLCSQAGEIPTAGDYVMVGGYIFTVTQADERRIEEVHARVMGARGDKVEEPQQGKGKAKGGGKGGDEESEEDAFVNLNSSPPAPPAPEDLRR